MFGNKIHLQLYSKDDKSVSPYAVKGRNWFSFDDEMSIRTKSEYVLSMGLGGGMIWSVDTDDFKGVCSGTKFPILTTMFQVHQRNSSK